MTRCCSGPSPVCSAISSTTSGSDAMQGSETILASMASSRASPCSLARAVLSDASITVQPTPLSPGLTPGARAIGIIRGVTDDARYRMPSATLWWSAAFLVLAVLVQATDFDRLNSFAVRHLEPLAHGQGHHRLNDLADLIVSPGSPTISGLLVS